MANPIANFGPPAVLTDGATISVPCSDGSHFTVTLGATGRTLTFVNPVPGQIVTVEVVQDATGSRTITTYNGTHVGGTDTVTWASSTAPTLTTTAAATDVLRFTYAAPIAPATAGKWRGETVGKAFG